MTRKQHYMSWILWTAFSLQVVHASEQELVFKPLGPVFVDGLACIVCYLNTTRETRQGLFPLRVAMASKPEDTLKASECTRNYSDFRYYESTITIVVKKKMHLDTFICSASLADTEPLQRLWTVTFANVPVMTGMTVVSARQVVTWTCRVSNATTKPDLLWEFSDSSGTHNISVIPGLNASVAEDCRSSVFESISTSHKLYDIDSKLTVTVPSGQTPFTLKCIVTRDAEKNYCTDVTINVHVGSDECSSNPCQHNGSCYVSYQRYICKCMENYHGSHCEVVTPSDPKIGCPEYLADGTASMTCECYADNNGAPYQARVGWTTPPPRHYDRYITLTDINRNTKGTYRCELYWCAPVELQWSAYRKYLEYEVKVAWGPSSEDVSINGPAYILVDDVPLVRVVCNWTDVNPDPEITWSGVTCDGDKPGPVCSFTPDPSFPKLLNVTCKVTNRFLPGKEVSVTHSISVKTLGLAKVRSFKANGYADIFLLTASDRLKPITLECLAMGDPLPEVRVYKILNYTHGIKIELSENSSQNTEPAISIAKNYTIAAPAGCDSVAKERYQCDVRNNRSSNSSVVMVALSCAAVKDTTTNTPTPNKQEIQKSQAVAIVGLSILGLVLLVLIFAAIVIFVQQGRAKRADGTTI